MIRRGFSLRFLPKIRNDIKILLCKTITCYIFIMEDLAFENRTSFYYFLSKFIYNLQQTPETLDKLSSVWPLFEQYSTLPEGLTPEELRQADSLLPEFLSFIDNGEIYSDLSSHESPHLDQAGSHSDSTVKGGPDPDRIYMDGCFDLMHSGHFNAVRQAKALGKVLVVGVHSDAEIALNKGPPVMNEQERYAMVRACKWVDEVIEDAPYSPTIELLDE